jgi:hypothetical protein
MTLKIFQQMCEDLGPSTIAAPVPETTVHRFPWTIAFRDVTPRSTGVQMPQDTVEDALVIQQRTSAPVVVGRVRQEGRDAFPLAWKKFVAMTHRAPLGKSVRAQSELYG